VVRIRALPVFLALALGSPGAMAQQIYRCEGPNGVIEYTNSPPTAGRACRTVETSITVIPAPKLPMPAAPGRSDKAGSPPSAGPGGAAAPGAARVGASPEGFPKVDPAAQRARDQDRRRILEEELRKEEARLAELQKEYNGGEPERRGDERNYQKYLDRVQRLKDDIQRAETNLGSIRRELGALKN